MHVQTYLVNIIYYIYSLSCIEPFFGILSYQNVFIMSQEVYKFYYRDFRDMSNNRIVTSFKQLEGLCKISARRLGNKLKRHPLYYDPEGRFYIERVLMVKDAGKSRR